MGSNKQFAEFLQVEQTTPSFGGVQAQLTTFPPQHDPVRAPSHYTGSAIECIDVIRMTLGDEGFVAYCLGNAMKYRFRTGKKGTSPAGEDEAKAEFYEQMAASVVNPEGVCDPRDN